MAKKITPGMLCWLTHCHFPKNNGLVVEVIEFYGRGTIGALEDDVFWRVKSRHPVRTLVRWENGGLSEVMADEFLMTTWQLIPINDPDAQLDDVRDLELQE